MTHERHLTRNGETYPIARVMNQVLTDDYPHTWLMTREEKTSPSGDSFVRSTLVFGMSQRLVWDPGDSYIKSPIQMEGRITKEEPLERHPEDLPDEAPQEDPSPMSPRDVRRRVPEDPEVEYRRSCAPAATD